jgi:hypothetical protein
MQRLSLAEQRAYVQARQAERDSLNTRLEKLSKQRAAWIATELSRLAGSGDSFDRSVSEMINAQAARTLK